MSDLFVYYERPAGISPDGLVGALRERGLDLEWRPIRLDLPDALQGRLVPSGNPDSEARVTVYEQDIRSYQRTELLEDFPADSPSGQREALEAADALTRVSPEVGEEFDAVRAAVVAAMLIARASSALIKREDASRVCSPEEFAEIEPIARDANGPGGAAP